MIPNIDTQLIEASSAGDVERCKALLMLGASTGASDKYGWTALAYAVYKEQIELCRILLEHGASTNSLDTDYLTPLHRAARSGYLEGCKVLIEFGANPEHVNGRIYSPLQMAVKYGQPEVVRYFLEDLKLDATGATPDGRTLHEVANDNHKPELSALLAQHRNSSVTQRTIDESIDVDAAAEPRPARAPSPL